jgi:hypothetical protein
MDSAPAPSPEPTGLGPALAERVRPRLGSLARFDSVGRIGRVAHRSVVFGATVGRAASGRLDPGPWGASASAVRPPFPRWPWTSEPEASSDGVLPSMPADRLDRAPSTPGDAPFVSLGDPKVDALRRLLRSREASPPTALAATPMVPEPQSESPREAPAATRIPDDRPRAGSRPPRRRPVAPGSTVAGPDTGPGQLGRRLRPDTGEREQRTNPTHDRSVPAAQHPGAPSPAAPSPTGPSPAGPQQPPRSRPRARRTAAQDVEALRRLVSSRHDPTPGATGPAESPQPRALNAPSRDGASAPEPHGETSSDGTGRVDRTAIDSALQRAETSPTMSPVIPTPPARESTTPALPTRDQMASAPPVALRTVPRSLDAQVLRRQRMDVVGTPTLLERIDRFDHPASAHVHPEHVEQAPVATVLPITVRPPTAPDTPVSDRAEALITPGPAPVPEAVRRSVERRRRAVRSPLSDVAQRTQLPHSLRDTRPPVSDTLQVDPLQVRPESPTVSAPTVSDTLQVDPLQVRPVSPTVSDTLQVAAVRERSPLIRPGTLFALGPVTGERGEPALRRSASIVPPGPGALQRAIRAERTRVAPVPTSDDPVVRRGTPPSTTSSNTSSNTSSTPLSPGDAPTLADRFLDELARSPRRRPEPLPQPFVPLAEAVTGHHRVMISTDDASRRALRSVGKVAATTDDVIHLAQPLRHDRRTTELVAHELTHVAHPSPAPRFFDDDDRGLEERRAEQIGKIMARAPIAPTAAVNAPATSGRAATNPRTAATTATVRRSMGPGASATTVSADDLARQLTGDGSGTVRRAPTRGRITAGGHRTAASPPPATPSPSTSSRSANAASSNSPPAAAAPALAKASAPTSASAEVDLASLLGSTEASEWFRRELGHHTDRIVQLLRDQIITDFERRGGRYWGGL